MKTAFLLIFSFVALSAFAQDRPASAFPANTVYVGGDGKYETSPDTVQLQFNISAQEQSSRAAYDRVSKMAEQTRQIFRANGIDPKVAEIGYYSVEPMYDYKDPKRKLIAYRVTTSVALKLKDFTRIPPVLEQLSTAGVTESQSLSYILEDTDAAKSKAVEDAYRRAHESAEALARAAGRTLGELSYASVDVSEGGGMPVPMMRKMTMAADAGPTEEFTPQKITVTAHVNASFGLK